MTNQAGNDVNETSDLDNKIDEILQQLSPGICLDDRQEDWDKLHDVAIQAIKKLIIDEKIKALNDLYDAAQQPESHDTCDMVHDHTIAYAINELAELQKKNEG